MESLMAVSKALFLFAWCSPPSTGPVLKLFSCKFSVSPRTRSGLFRLLTLYLGSANFRSVVSIKVAPILANCNSFSPYISLFIVAKQCWSRVQMELRFSQLVLTRAPAQSFLRGRCARALCPNRRTPPSPPIPPPPLPWKSAFGSAHCCIGGNVSENHF